jgi:two-component system, cell cycle sensor histidine kinase and response regulator CckA
VWRTGTSEGATEGVQALRGGARGYEAVTSIDLSEELRQAGERAVEESAPRPHGLAGMSAVVVEGEDAVRHFVVDTLRRSGVDVVSYASPDEALTHLGDPERPVDVLVTDVILPGMSGPEMVERIRSARPELAVVYMSGYAAEEAPYSALLRRATVLEKPFGAEELLERVSGADD